MQLLLLMMMTMVVVVEQRETVDEYIWMTTVMILNITI